MMDPSPVQPARAHGIGVRGRGLDTCNVADATFAAVRGLFSSAEVVELLVLIGYFRMICGLMTTLEVEVESPLGAKILDSVSDAVA
jgi:hypothetical protein